MMASLYQSGSCALPGRRSLRFRSWVSGCIGNLELENQTTHVGKGHVEREGPSINRPRNDGQAPAVNLATAAAVHCSVAIQNSAPIGAHRPHVPEPHLAIPQSAVATCLGR